MSMIFWTALLWLYACCVIGLFIGSARGRELSGWAWGLTLGPVGWIITLCSSDKRVHCAKCRALCQPEERVCPKCRTGK